MIRWIVFTSVIAALLLEAWLVAYPKGGLARTAADALLGPVDSAARYAIGVRSYLITAVFDPAGRMCWLYVNESMAYPHEFDLTVASVQEGEGAPANYTFAVIVNGSRVYGVSESGFRGRLVMKFHVPRCWKMMYVEAVVADADTGRILLSGKGAILLGKTWWKAIRLRR